MNWYLRMKNLVAAPFSQLRFKRALKIKTTGLKQLASLSGQAVSDEPPQCMVYDPFTEGHHALYTIEAAKNLSATHTVTVLSRNPTLLRERAAQLGIGVTEFKIVDLSDFANVSRPSTLFGMDVQNEMLAAYDFWIETLTARYAIFGKQPVALFLPYIDIFIPASLPSNLLDDFNDTTVSGIYFHPKWTRLPNQLPPEILTAQIFRNLYLLDHHKCTKIASITPATVMPFPDFAYLGLPEGDIIPPLTSELIKKKNGRKVISLLGSLERRKGLLPFLKLAESQKDLFFVCAGLLTREEFSLEELGYIDRLECNPPENLLIQTDEFISPEANLNDLLRHSDVIFLVYSNFSHSSNFITKAAAFKIPVLVSEVGYMAELVEKYNLGAICSDDTIGSLRGAISTIGEKAAWHSDGQQEFSALMSKRHIVLDV